VNLLKRLTAPEHLILGSFTTSLKWAGLNCLPFLILKNLLCFPWTKKWFSSENSIFSVLFFLHILVLRFHFVSKKLLFSSSLAFLPVSNGRCHTVLVLMWTSASIKFFCKLKPVFFAYHLQWLFGNSLSVTKA